MAELEQQVAHLQAQHASASAALRDEQLSADTAREAQVRSHVGPMLLSSMKAVDVQIIRSLLSADA